MRSWWLWRQSVLCLFNFGHMRPECRSHAPLALAHRAVCRAHSGVVLNLTLTLTVFGKMPPPTGQRGEFNAAASLRDLVPSAGATWRSFLAIHFVSFLHDFLCALQHACSAAVVLHCARTRRGFSRKPQHKGRHHCSVHGCNKTVSSHLLFCMFFVCCLCTLQNKWCGAIVLSCCSTRRRRRPSWCGGSFFSN